ncbi:MAG: hypothetical protein HC875_37895 [Anaerolineales bacterium]|nr:hypothetical protein [Anaerolineales bacterium]
MQRFGTEDGERLNKTLEKFGKLVQRIKLTPEQVKPMIEVARALQTAAVEGKETTLAGKAAAFLNALAEDNAEKALITLLEEPQTSKPAVPKRKPPQSPDPSNGGDKMPNTHIPPSALLGTGSNSGRLGSKAVKARLGREFGKRTPTVCPNPDNEKGRGGDRLL